MTECAENETLKSDHMAVGLSVEWFTESGLWCIRPSRMHHYYLFAVANAPRIGVGAILTVGCLRNRDEKSGCRIIRIKAIFRN